MTNKLGPEVLAELKAAEAKATPGPWRWTSRWGMMSVSGVVIEPDDTEHNFKRMVGDSIVFDDGSVDGEYSPIVDDDDGNLIAALRNAAPALLDAAERCATAIARAEAAEKERDDLARRLGETERKYMQLIRDTEGT